jgi:D-glycero-D-manno-heptose 1,7-bisphosphate phosphatase
MRRAVFLDRDGVINENRPDYVKSLEEFVVLPGVLQALCLLSNTEMSVIVVSNQSAINRGLVNTETVEEINRHMIDLAQSVGGRIDAVFYCPHRPEEGCDCRKPRPGLLMEATRQLGIHLPGSYMVGDTLSDVQAALRVGAQPLMVLTGRGRKQAALLIEQGLEKVPVFKDLREAAWWILKQESAPSSTPTARTSTQTL